MSNTPKTPGRSRRTAVIVIAALVVVVVVVAIIGIASALGGSSSTPSSTPSSAASTVTPSASSSASASASSSASASASATPKATKSATTAPTPQPTKTAAISKPATIAGSLKATVTKQEAVKGTATGPGEVAGPSVRFTITITNGTAEAVSLSNTVVNAYYGTAKSPAIELQKPGRKPFPASVAAGATATGVFVFNIPTAQRSKVEVTVDTSVSNPVVAFQGAAPK